MPKNKNFINYTANYIQKIGKTNCLNCISCYCTGFMLPFPRKRVKYMPARYLSKSASLFLHS